MSYLIVSHHVRLARENPECRDIDLGRHLLGARISRHWFRISSLLHVTILYGVKFYFPPAVEKVESDSDRRGIN
jgi:hypothetical protein